MDLFLKDKIAIVGGGSEGIGYGIAHMLASEGARVAIWARRETKLMPAAERMRAETGAEILPIQGDCRKAEDITRVFNTAMSHFGALDILINNDGAPPLGPLDSFDDEAWHQAIERNFMYVVRACRLAVPLMTARGGGSILNIISKVAVQPRARYALSTATWDAVMGYAKTLSMEAGPHNINVNTILSGSVETSRLAKVAFAGTDEEAAKARARRISEIPIGRIGTVEEMAALVALLVSPRGRFVNGTSIPVDGGSLMALR
jgi:3-oxoacyl-[acyl-carrier protein] reductase